MAALEACRLCGGRDLTEVADLGEVPPIHALARPGEETPRLPIHVFLCAVCGLVQMPPQADIEDVYGGSEIYTTAHNPGIYVGDLIAALLTFRDTGAGLEIGCNDGAFLAALDEAGLGPLTGIEPNPTARKEAQNRGFDVLDGYFSEQRATDLVSARGAFGFVAARHVLEHVEDVTGFLAGVHRVLKPGGVFLLELPHIEPGFEAGAPNVLWEEHINYFSESLVLAMLRNAGFEPCLKRFYTGGALVMAVLSRRSGIPATAQWPRGDADKAIYLDYRAKLDRYRECLHQTLETAKAEGLRIAVYGAGFRTSTTVNTMEIGGSIDLVIDDRAELKGLAMPGTDCAIAPLDAAAKGEAPILLMLGVGAENERKVVAKARRHFAVPIVPLSLVYPGDVTEHCLQAADLVRQMADRRAGTA